MQNEDHRPRWVRDLTRFLPLKSHFVLTGNVRDLQIRAIGGKAVAAQLGDVLAATLAEAGYAGVVGYDPVGGFWVMPRPDGGEPDADAVLTRLGLVPSGGRASGGGDVLAATLERLVALNGPPVALVADFASRLIVRSDALSPPEQALFTRALVLSQRAEARPVGPDRAPRFNTVVWIVEKEGDLPDWLTIDNPRIRHVPVAPPDRAARRAVAGSLIRGIPGAREASADDIAAAESELVDATEGMLLVDLNAVAQLARAEGVAIADVGEAVRRYKVGVTDDAWRAIERDRIRDGAAAIGRRVVGQEHAVIHMLDIVKRAAAGIGGGGRAFRMGGGCQEHEHCRQVIALHRVVSVSGCELGLAARVTLASAAPVIPPHRHSRKVKALSGGKLAGKLANGGAASGISTISRGSMSRP